MMEADGESIHANTKQLPHELVIEVLSWLPAHYLLQFRCVSKTWLQLLTLDPHFAQLHLDRSIQSNTLNPNPNPSILSMRSGESINLYYALDCTSSDRSIKLELPFHEGVDKLYNCIGVCNGLLCYSDNLYEHVYVGNPLTKDYISISCSPPSIRFPGLNNHTMFGFGFDQASNKYKVIRAFCENDYDQSVFHSSIYTLGVDSSWRTLDEDIQYDLCIETDHITFVNGALHWLYWGKGTPSTRDIVAFDLKNEVFEEIPRPNLKDDDFVDFDDIGEFGGLLCMYGYNIHHQIVFDFEIWIMKEYGVVGSWTKEFKIEDWQPYFDLRPLGFAKNGELMSATLGYKLVFYNPESKSLSILKQHLASVYTYIGSIISPRVISGGGQSLKEECI